MCTALRAGGDQHIAYLFATPKKAMEWFRDQKIVSLAYSFTVSNFGKNFFKHAAVVGGARHIYYGIRVAWRNLT